MTYTAALMEVLDLTAEDVVLTSACPSECDDCDDFNCPRFF